MSTRDYAISSMSLELTIRARRLARLLQVFDLQAGRRTGAFAIDEIGYARRDFIQDPRDDGSIETGMVVVNECLKRFALPVHLDQFGDVMNGYLGERDGYSVQHEKWRISVEVGYEPGL